MKEQIKKIEEVKTTLPQRMKCERYTRCVGYIRPIAQCNEGKAQEIADRVMFNVKEYE